MTRSIKNPKRPKTDKSGNAVRHIPHGVYNTVPLDALLKYLYKYNFHIFCTSFTIYLDKEKLDTFRPSKNGGSIILDAVNLMVEYSLDEDSKGNPLLAGIPIRESGFICKYDVDDGENPYFKTTVYLESKDLAKVINTKAVEVVSVGK